MAIDYSEFCNKVDSNLSANSDYTRFLIRVKRNGKVRRKVLDYSKRGWGKRDRIRFAGRELDSLIDKLESVQGGDVPKLRDYIQEYFKTLPATTWTTTRVRHYNNYIDKVLGLKKLDDILPMHIKDCMAKQERLGLHPRTVKTTLEVLRPMFREAVINRIVQFNPCEGLSVKIPKSKKMVTDASDKLKEIYSVIVDEFRDDPFYRAFFLLALMGRRKGEILKLRWENVSFEHNYVVLSDTKSSEIQKMFLSDSIKSALLEFYSDDCEWVFESPVLRGEHIKDVRKTVSRVKRRLPYFTLHYLRNIIVSAMAEQGRAAVSMSGALGHLSAHTIDKYLTLNYLDGSKVAAETIDNIIKR